MVPALASLPMPVNHAGPLAMMGGMLNQVSTLLMLVGWPHRPVLRGIGRTRPRPAGASFQRADQRGLLAADEGAGALDQFDVEVEAATQDVLAQQAVLPGLRDGDVQPVHRQRVFGADIDDSVRGAGDVAADRHAFEQRVRIALQLVAVHVGARIALVGVADQVFPVAHGLAQIFELHAGREAGAATAAQPGRLELFVHLLGRRRRAAPCAATGSRRSRCIPRCRRG